MPLYHHKMNHQSKFGEDWTSNNLDMTISENLNLPEIKKNSPAVLHIQLLKRSMQTLELCVSVSSSTLNELHVLKTA